MTFSSNPSTSARSTGLLCMGIVGGGIIPLLFDLIANATNLSTALVVSVCCYCAIAVYGWVYRKAIG